MLLHRTSPTRTTVHTPRTRVLAILLVLALLLGAQPPVAHAATLTVNSLDDPGDGTCDASQCTLREAIDAASSTVVDTIDFSVTGTIVLSNQLTIAKNLTITGPGESLLTISGNDTSRVFEISSGDYDVAISGVTIADGTAATSGGGVYNQSTGAVVLENVIFSGNLADAGGGMYNIGNSPLLTKVTFIDNAASGAGGGVYNNSSSPTLNEVAFISNYGCGMVNVGGSNPILNDVTFTSNTIGGMYNSASSPSLTNVTFSDNSAQYGGGMYNTSGSNPSLTDVDFISNYTTGGYAGRGGGMYNDSSNPTLINVTFLSNRSEFGTGGGMYNVGSNPVLTDVIFDSNYAGENNGGGIYNSGSSPILTNVTFRSNWANGNGGGIFNTSSSNPSLTGVTFSGNWAEFNGGGMSNINSSPSLTGVTFSGNQALFTDGGGMYNSDESNPILINVTFDSNSALYGGGIWNSLDSNPILTHVTISGNSALTGGGIYSLSVGTPTISNTILAGNNGVSGPDCFGTISSGDYNLVGNLLDCDFVPQANDQVGADPLLAPLTDNGGETQTRALLVGSPAIGAIPPGTNGCGITATNDQRGENRPYPAGGFCDIGAFEYFPPLLPDTGFTLGEFTALPAQPADKAYTALRGLWLELPDLGVQAPIVSVPFAAGGWDVSWLGSSAGYLSGSAFPTWPGNTVLTGHVWDATNRPGIFVDLKQLRYDDRIAIHAWGATYIYAVRESRLVSSQAVDIVMQHEEYDWITLLTCEDYRLDREGYIFRRMVRAVLVEVVPDR